MMGSLKSQSSWMMTASVTMSESHTRKEMRTLQGSMLLLLLRTRVIKTCHQRAGTVLGWDISRLSNLRRAEASHWQGSVGHTTPETGGWSLLGAPDISRH